VRVLADDSTYCPRSIYDCDSLEARLHASADVIVTPEFMTSSHEATDIDELCRFFKSPECSDSIVGQCKGEVVYATQIFKIRQQYICGERFARKEMNALKACARKTDRNLSSCHKKRNERLDEVNNLLQTSPVTHPWCNFTNDYITCVYTVMALGCAIEVAEKYMENFNFTSHFVDVVNGHGCSFSHPMEILKTTALPDITSQIYSRHGNYHSERSSPRLRNSSTSSASVSRTLLCLCCLLGFAAILFGQRDELWLLPERNIITSPAS
ncbi:hypothetical protein Bpfe_017129, partial [Biomphalaria pfeifferi]